MSISISDIINVSISISPNAQATDGFGPLLFMSKLFQPVAGELPVRSYSSLKEVQADFPTGEITNAATAWYGQKPMPKTFLVGAILNETEVQATPGKMVAKSAAVLADLKAIVDGTITINVDGVSHTATGINLSGAVDLAAANTLISSAFTTGNFGATVTQAAGVFTIQSATTGAKSVVSEASGNLAVAMKIDSVSAPNITYGADAKSIQSDLANIANTPNNFFYIAVDRAFRAKPQQMLIAKWAEASGKVFGWADSNELILKTGTQNSFKAARDANLRNTICVYDASGNKDEYPEVSILARAATVNFNVANSVLILAFKKGPGISTADLSSGQLAALESYHGNAFISVDGNVLFHNGMMADGTWFDTVQGVEWLTQKVRNNIFNLFYTSTTRIPWTETGVSAVNQQITIALELARTNGLISPGYDNEGNFYPDGYKVISTDLSLLQSQKGKRIWEGSSFIAIGSGALQGALVSGNFVQ